MDFEDNLSYCFAYINEENGNRLANYLMFYYGINVYIINHDAINEEGEIFPEYKVIAVDKDNYEIVIDKGIEFLNNNNIKDVLWYDACGFIRKSNMYEIAELHVPMERQVKPLWGINSKMPKDIKTYLKELDNYLGTDTYRECDDVCNIIYLSAPNKKYDEYSNKLEEYINAYGYGPFENIVPLSKYGTYKTKKISK